MLCIFCGKWIFKFRYIIQIFKGIVISCDVIKECHSFGYIDCTIHDKIYFIFDNIAVLAQSFTCCDVVTGEFPAQRPVARSFDVFFDLRLNKRLSKQSWGWWSETPSRSFRRHCNVRIPIINMRGSLDGLSFIVRIPVPVTASFYWIEARVC